jgi:hypothetical protein
MTIEQKHETERLQALLRELEREAAERWLRGIQPGAARNAGRPGNAASHRPR